jgi:hypothetical protein
MPDDRTTVTELATALGMLPFPTAAEAIASRPSELQLTETTWGHLSDLLHDGRFATEFSTAFANGRAFLRAGDALRGRPPAVIEWTGGRRPPGDEVAPIDLRIDHVYLISCKYFSANITNASPARVFDGLLATHGTWDRSDWYALVATTEYQALYRACRDAVELSALPSDARDLTTEQRQILRRALPGPKYPAGVESVHASFCAAVSRASAQRWRASIEGSSSGAGEAMLWRLLRVGNAPYFLLGADDTRALRFRVASPWDWRQFFRFRRLDIAAATAGQPRVDWTAVCEHRPTRTERVVQGHVEVRWSHGRFAQPPEAKVYLDVSVDVLPGYFPLESRPPELPLWSGVDA